jgi:hypothetical protein
MLRDIKNDMWYLGFTLRESKDKLIHFIRYRTLHDDSSPLGDHDEGIGIVR